MFSLFSPRFLLHELNLLFIDIFIIYDIFWKFNQLYLTKRFSNESNNLIQWIFSILKGVVYVICNDFFLYCTIFRLSRLRILRNVLTYVLGYVRNFDSAFQDYHKLFLIKLINILTITIKNFLLWISKLWKRVVTFLDKFSKITECLFTVHRAGSGFRQITYCTLLAHSNHS